MVEQGDDFLFQQPEDLFSVACILSLKIRAFRQRLALTVGSYWQEGFGSGGIQAIEYVHRWELDRDLSLRYGIGRSLRPYDGEREARNFASLVLLWRF